MLPGYDEIVKRMWLVWLWIRSYKGSRFVSPISEVALCLHSEPKCRLLLCTGINAFENKSEKALDNGDITQ